jgi:short-subunit dehydrogenase
MGSVLVIGGSRGLGAALAKGISDGGNINWVVSRTEPPFTASEAYRHIKWISADLNKPKLAAANVSEQIGSAPISAMIFNAGIWERASLAEVSEDLLCQIVNVNLTSAILLARRLLPNLKAASSPYVILIGSTCGLENEGARVSGCVATKFGLRGFAYSLRELLRRDGVRVCCVSPGSMATDLDYELGQDATLQKYKNKRMPVQDLVTIVQCLLSLSPAACVKEIIVPATADTDV